MGNVHVKNMCNEYGHHVHQLKEIDARIKIVIQAKVEKNGKYSFETTGPTYTFRHHSFNLNYTCRRFGSQIIAHVELAKALNCDTR